MTSAQNSKPVINSQPIWTPANTSQIRQLPLNTPTPNAVALSKQFDIKANAEQTNQSIHTQHNQWTREGICWNQLGSQFTNPTYLIGNDIPPAAIMQTLKQKGQGAKAFNDMQGMLVINNLLSQGYEASAEYYLNRPLTAEEKINKSITGTSALVGEQSNYTNKPLGSQNTPYVPPPIGPEPAPKNFMYTGADFGSQNENTDMSEAELAKAMRESHRDAALAALYRPGDADVMIANRVPPGSWEPSDGDWQRELEKADKALGRIPVSRDVIVNGEVAKVYGDTVNIAGQEYPASYLPAYQQINKEAPISSYLIKPVSNAIHNYIYPDNNQVAIHNTDTKYDDEDDKQGILDKLKDILYGHSDFDKVSANDQNALVNIDQVNKARNSLNKYQSDNGVKSNLSRKFYNPINNQWSDFSEWQESLKAYGQNEHYCAIHRQPVPGSMLTHATTYHSNKVLKNDPIKFAEHNTPPKIQGNGFKRRWLNRQPVKQIKFVSGKSIPILPAIVKKRKPNSS